MERKTIKKPADAYKERLRQAKTALKGKPLKTVLAELVKINPELDSLQNVLRWHNAWNCKCADVEITEALEQVVKNLEVPKPSKKLVRQRLSV